MINSKSAFIALGVTGLIIMGVGIQPLLKNAQIPSFTSSPQAEVIAVNSQADVKFPLFETSLLTNPHVKSTLEKMSNFDLSSDLKDNQISRVVAQVSFKNQYWFGALASEAEGFRGKIYNDNVGFAVGNGWNLSMQSSSYNQLLASTISDNQEYQKNAAAMASAKQKVVKDGDFSFEIAPQRALQVAGLMSLDFYKNGLLPALDKQAKKKGLTGQQVIAGLEPHQRDALIYHTYKVGNAGVAKYTTLLESVVQYSQLSTEKKSDIEEKKKVAANFTYKYKLDGKTLQDTRASVLVASMFIDTNVFAQIIQSVPQGVNRLSSQDFAKKLPDFKAGVEFGEEIKIPDPVGDAKNDMLKRGLVPDMKFNAVSPSDAVERMQNMRKPMQNNQTYIMGA